MSHVHRVPGEYVSNPPGPDFDHWPKRDCPDCLAREKAQEELVAEFVRQEERIEAREEEVKKLREAFNLFLDVMETYGTDIEQDDGSLVPVCETTGFHAAREALSSLDHAEES